MKVIKKNVMLAMFAFSMAFCAGSKLYGQQSAHASHQGYTLLSIDVISTPSITTGFLPATGWDEIRNELKYNACNDDEVDVTWSFQEDAEKKKTVQVGGNVSVRAKSGALTSVIVEGEVGGGGSAQWSWESEPISYNSSFGPVTLESCGARRFKNKVKQKTATIVPGTMASWDEFLCSGSVVNSVYTAHSPTIPSTKFNHITDGSGNAKGRIDNANGMSSASLSESGETCQSCLSSQ